MRHPDSIWFLKRDPWSDAPMFYPPGKHPATQAYKDYLARLEELGLGSHEMAGWLRDKTAEFEGRESEAKAAYAAMLAGGC